MDERLSDFNKINYITLNMVYFELCRRVNKEYIHSARGKE